MFASSVGFALYKGLFDIEDLLDIKCYQSLGFSNHHLTAFGFDNHRF